MRDDSQDLVIHVAIVDGEPVAVASFETDDHLYRLSTKLMATAMNPVTGEYEETAPCELEADFRAKWKERWLEDPEESLDISGFTVHRIADTMYRVLHDWMWKEET